MPLGQDSVPERMLVLRQDSAERQDGASWQEGVPSINMTWDVFNWADGKPCVGVRVHNC